MLLLLDMGLSPTTARHLCASGHDAVHLHERGLSKLPDDQILQLALAERRVLITFDLDFARLLALLRLAEPSVVLFRVESVKTQQMNAWLDDLLTRYAAELERGAIVMIEDERERVRPLPIWRDEGTRG